MVTATVVIDEVSEATAVPDSALGRDDAGHYVLVEQGSRARRVDVTAGPRERDWVAVEPPLPAGTRVVTSSLAGLDLSRPVLAVAP